MPTKSSDIKRIAVSFRLPMALVAHLKERAAESGSVSDVIEHLLEDDLTLYGLPDDMRELVLEDAKKMGKSQRDYVAFLVSKRFQELFKDKLLAEGEKPRPKK